MKLTDKINLIIELSKEIRQEIKSNGQSNVPLDKVYGIFIVITERETKEKNRYKEIYSGCAMEANTLLDMISRAVHKIEIIQGTKNN